MQFHLTEVADVSAKWSSYRSEGLLGLGHPQTHDQDVHHNESKVPQFES